MLVESELARATTDASTAMERGDLHEALRHWALVRSYAPADPAGYLRPALALSRAGGSEEAERILLAGIRNCTDTFELMIEYAWIAHYRSEWDEALDRWSRLATSFPRHSAGAVGVARCLVQLGKIDQAESYLAGLEFAPADDVDAGIAFAEIASSRRDWTEAVRRWGTLRSAYPEHPRVIDGYGQALWQLNSDEAETVSKPRHNLIPPESAGLRRPVDVPAVRDAETRDLLLKFQSLGENCEFGLVQRRFGAEPIGLFRWTYLPPERAIRLLQSRFAGIGAVQNTKLSVSHYHEYFVEDMQNDLVFHTFLPEGSADPAVLLAQNCRRLERLREKLIEDLESGEHIFVYKLQYDACEETLARMQAALREYGPNTLVCVRTKDGANPAGSVRVAADGVIYGYLERSCPIVGPSGEIWDIAFDDWKSVCRKALELRDASNGILEADRSNLPELGRAVHPS